MSTKLNPNKHPGRHLNKMCQLSFIRSTGTEHAVSHTRINANRHCAVVPRRCAEQNRGVSSPASKWVDTRTYDDVAIVCETVKPGTFHCTFGSFEDLCTSLSITESQLGSCF